MMRYPHRPLVYLFCLLLGLLALGLLLFWLQEATAQVVTTNVPIPRHVVLYNAASFYTFLWTPDADSVAGRTYLPAVPRRPPQVTTTPAVSAREYRSPAWPTSMKALLLSGGCPPDRSPYQPIYRSTGFAGYKDDRHLAV